MILCSSGALFQPEVFDGDSIVKFGPTLPVDGLEILVTRRMIGQLAEVAEQLSSTTLQFPVVHAPKRAGSTLPSADAVEQLEETAEFGASIGAELVVLHLWDLPDSDADFDDRLDAAVLAADIVGSKGITLAVETIPCTHQTPLVNVARVLERDPRIRVALDTEFLAFHGELQLALDADWLWVDEAVRHMHLKDYAGSLFDAAGVRRYLLPGDGAIDFPRVFDVLDGRGYKGSVTLEAAALTPDGAPDIEALTRCLARIKRRPWAFN